ncbi:MAG: hypothetical protein M1510_11740 [Nitrospirae bacterium]|nr:hypothetical protein [Nitrospirota bacterium]MCL5237863.1 hypothetical protein [Nitrospirota bacterium]
MQIDCYISVRCGSEEALKKNIYSALELESVHATVNFHRIDDEEAARLGLKGSPSVFVNGQEIQPLEAGGFS